MEDTIQPNVHSDFFVAPNAKCQSYFDLGIHINLFVVYEILH